jgi:uncharacterized protein YehS (DUF1456 family)
VRCRPFRALNFDVKPVFKSKSKTVLLINPSSNKILEFDRYNSLFHERSDQEKVYRQCGEEIVRQVLNGYDSSVIKLIVC